MKKEVAHHATAGGFFVEVVELEVPVVRKEP